MAFPQDVLRLSELVADLIVGAIYKTATSGPRWVIGASSGPTNSKIQGFTDDPVESATDPANLVVTNGTANQVEVGLWAAVTSWLGGGVATAVLRLLSTSTGTVAIIEGMAIRFIQRASNGIITNTLDFNSTGFSFNGSQPMKHFDFGTAVVPIAGSSVGSVVVPHGLGVVPTVVLVSARNTFSYFATSGGFAANQFVAQCRQYDTVGGTTNITVDWIAIA